jgi:anti-sigma B factor antagonist
MEPTSRLQIDRLPDPQERVLQLRGALDAYTAPTLRDELDAVPLDPPERVVLDLAELGFLDSTGLRVLVEAHANLTGAGGELRLRNAPETTRRLLDITGLADVLGVEKQL